MTTILTGGRPITFSPAILVHLMIFLTPFGVYSFSMGGGADMALVSIYQILLIPLFVAVCLMRNSLPNMTPLGLLHLGFLFIMLVGGIFADNTMSAVRGSGVYFLKFILAYLYTIYFLRTRESVETAVKIFLWMGVASAVMALVQLAGFFLFGEIIMPPFAEHFDSVLSEKSFGFGTGAFSIPGFARAQGFFTQGSDLYPTYMIIPFALALYVVWQHRRRRHFLLATFFGFAILISASRCAYVGAVMALTILYFFRQKRRYRMPPYLTRFYVVVCAVMLLVSAAFLARNADFYAQSEVSIDANTARATPVFLLERINPFAAKNFSTTKDYFTEHAMLAVKYCLTNFGLGRGVQNFDDYVYEKYPVHYGSHSNFILFLGETGIIGFLLQVGIAVLTIGLGLKTYLSQPAGGGRDHLPLFLSAIFYGLVWTGIVRTFYMATPTFIIAGMIVRLYLLQRAELKHRGAT